jgi:hypothetical protein
MKRIALAFAALVFSSVALADPVVEAYDEAYAAATVALEMHKVCEKALRKKDLKPCNASSKANGIYLEKMQSFLASVEPKDFFLHVTREQDARLSSVSKQINASLDSQYAYIQANK